MISYRFLETVWTLTILSVLAIAVWSLTGCTGVQCVKPIISIERPILPETQASEFRCVDGEKCEQLQITSEVYRSLRLRDLLLHQYAEQLELTVRELAEVPQ